MVKNSNKFRQPAIHFQEYGYYTSAPKGTTAYKLYWDEETKRCLNGYIAEDGDYITGYNYFYLNYCPILRVVEKKIDLGNNQIRTSLERVRDFPLFFDSDYEYFLHIEEAERLGKHVVVLKARGKGYSFKGSSMLCRNFYLVPESKSYAIAAETEFLTKDGLLTKAWDLMSWIDQNTAWTKKRQKIDTKMHKRASYIISKDGTLIESGIMSEVMGVTLKNDPQKARGKRGKLILWEEAGVFPGLKAAWQIARPSVEDGGRAFGLMIAYGTGGCVCAGTKVWTNDGKLVNIENLLQSDGILGFDGDGISKENILSLNPPSQKQCYRISTNTRRILECSEDHPILVKSDIITINHGYKTKGVFTQTCKLNIGDKIAIANEIPIFGNKKMWEPRLVGWLIGDGTYGLDQTVRLSNCEDEITDYIEINFDSKINREHVTKLGKLYKEIRIKGITKNLRELGIYGQTKLNKTLPIDIHSYCKEDICSLLGGLFDTDGYVNIRTNKKRNTSIAEVSISSMSESLLNEIRFLLQKLGIHGRIRQRNPRINNSKDKNPWYEYTIADQRSLIKFSDNIELIPRVKRERLSLIREVYSTIIPSSNDIEVRYEKIVNIENIGYKNIYNLTAGISHTYIANGIITHNTEGADYESLKDLFYEPDAYNIHSVDNVWDEGATKKCGFFIPEYSNLFGKDDQDRPFMDEDGNSIKEIAIPHILKERQKIIDNATDRTAIDRYIAERPLNPMEATLQISGNIFPKKDLTRHLAHIRNSEDIKNYRQVGELYFDPDGTIKWRQDKKYKDLRKYKLEKGDSRDGAVVIWEHPMNKPPYGLYIAGLDPYDHNKSGTDSLGSIFIYKRFQSFEHTYDTIVAEYTGRPDTADLFYENARKLLLYYNAVVLYENQWPGFSVYMKNKHCDHMLADQPDIISKIIKDSRVQRGKGIHMNSQIKDWGEGKLRDWLIEEYEPGKKNLTKIYSEPLLEELIAYNDKGNFDRVIAMFLIMIYKEELHDLHVKSKQETERTRKLFESPLFGESQFNTFN